MYYPGKSHIVELSLRVPTPDLGGPTAGLKEGFEVLGGPSFSSASPNYILARVYISPKNTERAPLGSLRSQPGPG